jgi:mannose-6-phosphate isomerase-like protein (cupin superfamily)
MSVFTQNVNDPALCIVRTGRGERVSQELAGLLNPVDPATFHQFRLRANADVELHYHDVDEYWWFTEGNPKVTLRSPTGMVKEFALEPGDMVACVRGVEHTLRADHQLVYYQFSSVPTGGERQGHLTRQVTTNAGVSDLAPRKRRPG